MKAAGLYLGRFEGIIRREMDSDKENTTSIGTFIWTNNGCLPVEHILTQRTWENHNSHITLDWCIIAAITKITKSKFQSAPLPALHEVGGSLSKSLSSFRILLDAIRVTTNSYVDGEIGGQEDVENNLMASRGCSHI